MKRVYKRNKINRDKLFKIGLLIDMIIVFLEIITLNAPLIDKILEKI